MFDETNTDVNTGAASSAAQPTSATSAPAAEPSTTEIDAGITEGKAVPYERFKQINEKRKESEKLATEFKTKLAERDKEFETYKPGIELQKTAIKDPVFAKKVNEIINLQNGGKLTDAEAAAAVSNAKDASDNRLGLDPEVQEIKKTLQKHEQSRRDEIISRYLDRFNTKAKEAGYEDEEDKNLLENLTTKFLLQKNPKAAEKFSQTELDEAYSKAEETVANLVKRKTAAYVKTKVSEQPPTSKPGAAGTATHEFKTHGEEVQYFATGLKARRGKSE